MTGSTFATISYEERDRQVSWCGVSMEDGAAFTSFMTTEVASRLHDKNSAIGFEAHLRGLAITGFARESLDAVLMAEIPEERDWAVCEAMAEVHLTREHGVSWPWNMERDKRNPRASLPGADLVGFKISGDDIHLALGEVKASADTQTPPGVMSGRRGMPHQIENLANELSLICQLLKWLHPRCKGTEYETSFDKAVGLFFGSGNKAVALFGVLIRETRPDIRDLEARGRTLAKSLQDPTTCQLIAIYLPCTIQSLPARVSGGGP